MKLILVAFLFLAGCSAFPIATTQPISPTERAARLQRDLDFSVAAATLIHDAGGFNSRQWIAIQTAQSAGQAAVNAYIVASDGKAIDATRLLQLADEAVKAYRAIAKK